MKVHLLYEGYAWVPKRRDFTEEPREEILGNQNFRDKEVFLRPPLVLLHSKSRRLFLLWFIFRSKGRLVVFFFLFFFFP